MKKALSVIIALCLVIVVFAVPTLAAKGDWYNFGGAYSTLTADYWGPDAGNFTYQCTTEHNIGDATYDTTKFTDLVFGTNTTYAAWGGNFWCPSDAVVADNKAFKDGNFWFLLDGKGSINPAGGVSAIVTFTAPWAADYYLMTSYEGGIAEANQSNPNTDGVTFSIYNGGTKLHSENTGNAYKYGQYASDALSLKEGDKVYFIVDGNEFQDYDTGKYKIQIMESAAWSSFYYGNWKDSGEPLEAQGVNNFYYMYSDAINKGDNFDVSTLNEAKIVSDASLPTATDYVAYGPSWSPDPEKASAFDRNTYGHVWWKIGDQGDIVPAGGKTAAVKWVAPEDGKYNLFANIRAGINLTNIGKEQKDGVTVSIYNGTTKLYSQNANESLRDFYFEKTALELKKGDVLYFIADPNQYDDNAEFSNWTIDVECTEVIKDTSDTSSNTNSESGNEEEVKDPGTTSSNTDNEPSKDDKNASSNPDTSDMLLILPLFGLAIGAVTTAAAARKKK